MQDITSLGLNKPDRTTFGCFFSIGKLPASKAVVNRGRAWFCIIACIGNKTNQGMMRASEWLAEDLMQGIHLYATHN
jgi:hypothetical protein